MSNRYFEKFRLVNYKDTTAVDITQRTVFLTSVYNNPLLYYQYDIAEGERADLLSDRYYNDQYLTWLLYTANKIVDPYYDWYLDNSSFDAVMTKKYGSLVNATSKIKHYRNNWYSDPNPTITNSQYAALEPSLAKFYEPVPDNGLITLDPSNYSRRRIDWTIETNAIVKYTLDEGQSTNTFILDELVDVNFTQPKQGLGQVLFRDDRTLMIKNVSGLVVSNTINANSTLTGRESNTSVQFIDSTLVANNIPSAETNFWSPVTYYDYEMDLNENNRSIQVLKNQYSRQASRQLKTLLE